MRRSVDAFTYVEILVASAILAVALAPLFVMQAQAVWRARAGAPDLAAAALAAEVAEQLRAAPPAALPVARPARFTLPAGHAADAPVTLPGGEPYALVLGTYPVDAEVEVLAEPLDPPDQLARLTVTVAWRDASAGSRREHRRVEIVDLLEGSHAPAP